MSDGDRLLEILHAVHEGLPRQGPGDSASTRRALALCAGLPPSPSVVDVGCGPGMQTIALAEAGCGPIVAVDLWRPFLDQLRVAAEVAGAAHRILPVVADMARLPVADGAFDLVWAEGSAYAIGFPEALRAFRRVLKPGGYVAASELVWLVPDPPAQAAAFFAAEYPAMGDVAAAEGAVEAAGYALAGSFVLPDHAWWSDYYGPLEARLPAMAARFAADSLAYVARAAREIEMRRRFPDAYGYLFVVGRIPG